MSDEPPGPDRHRSRRTDCASRGHWRSLLDARRAKLLDLSAAPLPYQVLRSRPVRSQTAMLAVPEATQVILETLQPLATEIIPFTEALGRVLADDLIADAPIPRFPQSAMDGFALRSA